MVFFVRESLGNLEEPRGIKKITKKSFPVLSFVVDLNIGKKSALFDHLNLSVDCFEGMSS